MTDRGSRCRPVLPTVDDPPRLDRVGAPPAWSLAGCALVDVTGAPAAAAGVAAWARVGVAGGAWLRGRRVGRRRHGRRRGGRAGRGGCRRLRSRGRWFGRDLARWRGHGGAVARPGPSPGHRRGDRGPERHPVLRVGVDRHRPAEGRRDQLGDERRARRPPTSSTVVTSPGSTSRRPQRPGERRDRVGQGRAHHLLVLGAGEPHLGLQLRQQHRDRDVAVGRQRLLGVDALLPQPGRGRHRGGIVGRQLVERRADGRGHVVVDGDVEVDPAEALDPLGRAPARPTPRPSCAAPRRRRCRRRGRRRR